MNDNGKYGYNIFGIHITSDFLLSEGTPATGAADVEILKGKVPDQLEGAIRVRDVLQVLPGELLLNISGTGKYHILNGRRIVVQPEDGVNMNLLKLYLLGSAFGALLMQRGVVPIHGSAVVVDGKGIIVTGESGAGKSTLCADFRKCGFSFLTDDVVALVMDEQGKAIIQPAYPQQKLWQDCIEAQGDEVGSYQRIIREEPKYAVLALEGFSQVAVPLTAIVELRKSEVETASLCQIQGVEKMSLFMKNTYRRQFVGLLGLQESFFRKYAMIVNQASAFVLTRPENGYSVRSLRKMILEGIGA